MQKVAPVEKFETVFSSLVIAARRGMKNFFD